MASLSQMEKRELNKIFTSAKHIKTSLDKNMDNVQDVICKQIEVTTSEDEIQTLNGFMEFIQDSFSHIEDIINNSEELKEHFIK